MVVQNGEKPAPNNQEQREANDKKTDSQEQVLSLMERFESGEDLSDEGIQELENIQLKKMATMRNKMAHVVDHIEDPKLKESIQVAIKNWENNEVKGKIYTNEEIKNISEYLPHNMNT